MVRPSNTEAMESCARRSNSKRSALENSGGAASEGAMANDELG